VTKTRTGASGPRAAGPGGLSRLPVIMIRRTRRPAAAGTVAPAVPARGPGPAFNLKSPAGGESLQCTDGAQASESGSDRDRPTVTVGRGGRGLRQHGAASLAPAAAAARAARAAKVR
jgi:hypothetical protein